MSKLIMLSGLPASGKSTTAKEIVNNGGWVRVNRDLLRTMLHFDKWSNRNEGYTVDAEKALVRSFLLAGINVVVDDTNLNPKNREMWSGIAKECGASFEGVRVSASVTDCIDRDREREKRVGDHVIRNMALQYDLGGEHPEMGYVLCDIDGTVADIEHRRHFVQTDPKDWNGFFDAMGEDTLRADTAELLDFYKGQGHTIIYVSARPEKYRAKTEKWLREKNIGFHYTLLMRPDNDTRPDTIIKKNILDAYFPGDKKKRIFLVIDDRPSVIRMWRENGLDVTDVGNGVEF